MIYGENRKRCLDLINSMTSTKEAELQIGTDLPLKKVEEIKRLLNE